MSLDRNTIIEITLAKISLISMAIGFSADKVHWVAQWLQPILANLSYLVSITAGSIAIFKLVLGYIKERNK